MAFDLRNWSRVTDSMNTGAKDLGSLGRVNAPAIFSYRSDTDTQGQIASGNYFGAEAQNISPQDIIWATASNGVVQYRVTAVDRAAFLVTIQAISGGSSGVSSVTGTANEVEVDNTDSQNPVIGLPSALDIPGTLTVQNTVAIDAIIDDDTMAAASDTNIPTAESVKAYVDGLDSGSVKSVTGTANEVEIDNTDTQNPIAKLPLAVDAPGTFTIQNTIALDSIIDDDTFATATATNVPTSESVKNYVDGLDGGSVKSVTGTANEVEVDNTDAQNPVVGLPNALNIPGTLTVQNTIVIDAIIDDDTMTTATDTNIPTAESVKAYVDQRVYQGDWLPDPFFQTAGTSTWSMNRVGGRWWRQNNLVTVNGYYRGNVTVGDASGLFIMGGLPFPYHYANSNPNWNGRTVQAFNWDISSMPIDFEDFSMFVMCLEWASELQIKKLKTGLAEDVTADDFSDGLIDISFSLTYRTEL